MTTPTRSREHTIAIKRALKQEWPDVKFSVRRSRGWGLEVEWTDGPSRADVEEITGRFGECSPCTSRHISRATWDKATALWKAHGRAFQTFPLGGVPIVSGSREQQVWQIAMNVVLAGRDVRKAPRQVRTDRVLRYSPNSALVSTTVEGILKWAADHVTHVGLAQNDQGRMFDGPGTIRTLRCDARGALEVAAGKGRFSRRRTYDWDAIEAAKDGACRALADYLRQRSAIRQDNPHMVLYEWSTNPSLTTEEVATVLRAAAQRVTAQ